MIRNSFPIDLENPLGNVENFPHYYYLILKEMVSYLPRN